MSAGEVSFCLTGDAELILVKPSTEAFEPIAQYTVADSPTQAPPVIFENYILIKDTSNLMLWSIDNPDLADVE